MIQLYLNNNKVQISTDQSFKLNRENPNISSSGDYTFDVNIPLSIADNRIFFGPWHRIEANKDIKTYSARLYADNICILNGSAKVTGITNDVVKLQLYGDRSEFNAVHGDKFIDELNLPYFTKSTNGGFGGGRGTRAEDLTMPDERWDTYIYTPIYNESADKVVNYLTSASLLDKTSIPYFAKERQYEAQFNLLYVIKCIFHSIGYKIDVSEYDAAPYNRIYIASCISSKQMIHALPHWTLKGFVAELQKFFGCNFIFSSSSLSVTMKPGFNGNVYDISRCSSFPTIDEFSIEISDDAEIESVNSSDLHYDLSSSSYHDIDYFDDMKLDALPTKSYPTYNELMSAYQSMSAEEKGKYIFRCPEGDYCEWIYNSPSKPEDKKKLFIHINHFGDLKRDGNNENGNVLDLKICPVAIADAIPVQLYAQYSNSGGSHNHGTDIRPIKDRYCYQTMPSMEGRDAEQPKGHFAGGKPEETTVVLDTTVIQDLIEGESTSADYVKPDRMEVFFWDGTYQQASEFEYSGKTVNVNAPATFTAHDLKNIRGAQHLPWSMSLKKDIASVLTMGKGQSKYKICQDKKFCVKFLSEHIPSAADIFMFDNRKFIAETIEISFSDGKMDRLMTGYFYEIS